MAGAIYGIRYSPVLGGPGLYPVSDNPIYSMGRCTLVEYILCVAYSLASDDHMVS